MAEGEQQTTGQPTRRRNRAVAAAALAALLLWSWVAYGPHVLDDAYITFRYSRNLATGRGLVYNPGERVQGFSTPLMCLLSGAAGAIGLDIPSAGVAVSGCAGLAVLVLLIFAGRRLEAEEAGWVASSALATQFFWVLLWVSGMETTLYCLLILATMLRVAQEQWRWTGALIGLTCLTRYDGVILGVAAMVFVLWKGGWRVALREALVAAALYLPWLVFAWAYFGSPVPQTVFAKRVINVLDWGKLFSQYQMYLDYSPLLWVWLAFAVEGMTLAVARRSAWGVFPVWMALYLGAFILERRPVIFYPWYLVPLLPPVMLFGAYGLFEALRWVFARTVALRGTAAHTSAVFAALAALAVFYQTGMLWNRRADFGRDAFHRERKYRMAADILRPHIRPGQSIYVGEVGTLGWFLPQARVIDSAGLLSPEVYRIRLRDRDNLARQGKRPEDFMDGSADVTRMVLEELRPDFIATHKQFLFLRELQSAPDFRRHYVALETAPLDLLDQWAFERKQTPPRQEGLPEARAKP